MEGVTSSQNSFDAQSTLTVNGTELTYFSLQAESLANFGVARLPYSIKVLLENLLRHEDGVKVTKGDIEALARWAETPGRHGEAAGDEKEQGRRDGDTEGDRGECECGRRQRASEGDERRRRAEILADEPARQVRQDDVGEYRSFYELELTLFVQYFRACNVAGHQIGGELNTLERQEQCVGN